MLTSTPTLSGPALSGPALSGRTHWGRGFSRRALSGRTHSGRTRSGRGFSHPTLSGPGLSGRTPSGRTRSGRTPSGRTHSGRGFSHPTLSGPGLPGASLSAYASTAGLVAGLVADRLLGDPRRGHPVAGFGRLASAVEARLYADRRGAGVAYAGLLVGGPVLVGLIADRLTAKRPMLRFLSTAAATWAVLGGRSLEREARTVQQQLSSGDLPAARTQIRHLVGRDPSGLGPAELARACVESVAENTSDAVIAPLVWGAIAGLPGLLAYRAANTLDAMAGHRNQRYRRFGWAAARLDDVANWLPARLTAALVILLGDDLGGAVRAVWRDAAAHPSPNAGVVEAAFAGALGVRLGGSNTYDGVAEQRGILGDGRPAGVADIPRAIRLARRVALAAAALVTAASLSRLVRISAPQGVLRF